jgi:hypothetical protein
VGSVAVGSWLPVATDGMYFVKPIDTSVLLRNLPTWDPPSLPDKPSQLIDQLKTPGFYTSVDFSFNGKSTTKSFLVLATTYGYPGQNTGSSYCQQHPGLCTAERGVTETAGLGGEKPLGINFISFGNGKIFMPKVGHINLLPASHLTIGPMANAMRANIINAATASYASGGSGGNAVSSPEDKPKQSVGLLPSFKQELQGTNSVRVRNPNDFAVTAGIRSGENGKNFVIPANGENTVNVPDGKYDIFFVYSDKPDALFQGDSFTLNNEEIEIQIVKSVNGNYGIRQVK